MRLLFFNDNEELYAVKTQAISATISEEINLFHQLNVELPLNSINARDIGPLAYIAVATEQGDGYYLFKVEKPEIGDTTINISAVEKASDDLSIQDYIKDRRFDNSPLTSALDAVFTGSTWEYKLFAENTLATTNFYYVTRKAALTNIEEVWKVEARFVYHIEHNRIVSRVCEIYKFLGKDTNYRFIYGTNALKVNFSNDRTALYTAAIGRGAGIEATDDQGETTGGYTRRIDFSSVSWSKASGKPVDKPSGQNFVEIPEATQKYGWIDSSGVKHPRMAIFEFDDEKDPTSLLQKTYEKLVSYSAPLLTATSTVALLGKKINLGDSISIVRYGDGFNFVYKLRVTSVKRDLLNDKRTEIQIGNDNTVRMADRESAVINTLDSITANVDSSLSDQEARARSMINDFNNKLTQRIDSTKSSIDKVLAQNSNGPITLIGQDGQSITGVPEIKEIRSKDGSFLINSSGFKWGDHLMGGDSKIYADEIAGKVLDAYTINSTTINGGKIIGATISGQIYINSTSNPRLYPTGHERYAVISGDYGFTYTSAGGDGGRGSWLGLYSLGIGGVDLNADQLRKIKEKCGV